MEEIILKPEIELSKEKQIDLNELIKDDMIDVKYKVLTQILLEKNIEYDMDIQNYDQLKKFLNKNLKKSDLEKINNEEKEANEQISHFIKELQKDGPITMKKVVNSFNDKILKPSAKTAMIFGISRVLFDAMLFVPSVARTIVGVASLGVTIYKGKKGTLNRKKAEQARQYDELISKMEKTKDENGNIVLDQFTSKEIEVIKDFLEKNGTKIESPLYTSMMDEVKKLDNSKKLKLINEINKVTSNKIDINHELSKERKKFKLKNIISGIEKVVLGVGTGMILANFDKEFTKLINLRIPRIETEKIFRSRTLFTQEHLENTNLLPIGFIGGAGIIVARNIILQAINSISQKMKEKNNVEEPPKENFNKEEKMIFEILKNKMLYKFPQDTEKLDNINNIKDLKEYMKNLPLKEQKEQINMLEDLNKQIHRTSGKEKIKELGKLLGDSILLAGNSMLVYQLFLFLKGEIPKFLNDRNSNEQDGTPRPQEEYSTDNVTETGTEEVFGPERPEVFESGKAEVFGPELPEGFEPGKAEVFGPELPEGFKPVETMQNVSTENVTHEPILRPTPERPETIPSNNDNKINLDNAKTIGKVALGTTILYWGIKGLAAAGSVLFPEAAPVLAPVVIGG